MPDALTVLRERTMLRHRALEDRPLLRAMAGEGLTPSHLGAFVSLLQSFYAGLEPGLLPALQGHPAAALYRPRRALLAGDLARLGLPLPPAAIVDAYPSTPGGLLGVVYAVEGSALGGQVIARQIAAVLGERMAESVQSFSVLGKGMGPHWQAVLACLRAELTDAAALNAAVDGAAAVFSTLGRLADAQESAACQPPPSALNNSTAAASLA